MAWRTVGSVSFNPLTSIPYIMYLKLCHIRCSMIILKSMTGLHPESQDKIRVLKANLQSCKTLLRCKREELKRLWVDDVKYKHMLKMIDAM